jgi:hypothetical protein
MALLQPLKVQGPQGSSRVPHGSFSVAKFCRGSAGAGMPRVLAFMLQAGCGRHSKTSLSHEKDTAIFSFVAIISIVLVPHPSLGRTRWSHFRTLLQAHAETGMFSPSLRNDMQALDPEMRHCSLSLVPISILPPVMEKLE